MLYITLYKCGCIHCVHYGIGTVINFSTAPTNGLQRIEVCRYNNRNFTLMHDTSECWCIYFERKASVMSHISKLKCKGLNDKDLIISALKEMGFNIVDGAVVGHGSLSADTEFRLSEKKSIGFAKDEEENYNVVGDFWRTGIEEDEFVHKLETNYQAKLLEKTMISNWRVETKEVLDGDRLKIVLCERL